MDQDVLSEMGGALADGLVGIGSDRSYDYGVGVRRMF